MPAYVIAIRDKTTDPAELAEYGRKAGEARTPDLKILARGSGEALEGPPPEGVILIGFDSKESARAWYDSPGYAEARAHRLKGADYQMILLDGVDAPGGPLTGAYIFALREHTRDPEAMNTYRAVYGEEKPGLPEHRLTAWSGPPAGPCEVLEGPPLEGALVISFPSVEGAKAWYDSPGYRNARQHRHKGADFRFILVEGREPAV